MVSRRQNVLVIGYGNPGRLDDGLGAAMAEAVEAMDLPGVTVEADYQLSVEHAEMVSRHSAVIFADADTQCAEPFSFARITPEAQQRFTTHSVSPQAVLALAHDLFAAETTGYLLGIRGYAFNEFGQGLSDAAARNLAAATDFIERTLRRGLFAQAAGRSEMKPTNTVTTSHGD